LLDDAATIGTRSGWADRLRERGYALRGHRLVRSRAGDEPARPQSDDGAGEDQQEIGGDEPDG
jgi:hypothetical protein